MMNNTKGSTLDVATVIVVGLVVFAIAALFGNLFFDAYYAQAQAIPIMANSNATMSILYEGEFFYSNTADNLALAIFMGANLAAAIMAFIFGQNPVFKAFLIIVNLFYLVFAGIFQLWWEYYGSNSVWAGVIGNFPKMNFILNNLAIFALVSIFIITVALFAKGRQEGNFG